MDNFQKPTIKDPGHTYTNESNQIKQQAPMDKPQNQKNVEAKTKPIQ